MHVPHRRRLYVFELRDCFSGLVQSGIYLWVQLHDLGTADVEDRHGRNKSHIGDCTHWHMFCAKYINAEGRANHEALCTTKDKDDEGSQDEANTKATQDTSANCDSPIRNIMQLYHRLCVSRDK